MYKHIGIWLQCSWRLWIESFSAFVIRLRCKWCIKDRTFYAIMLILWMSLESGLLLTKKKAITKNCVCLWHMHFYTKKWMMICLEQLIFLECAFCLVATNTKFNWLYEMNIVASIQCCHTLKPSNHSVLYIQNEKK